MEEHDELVWTKNQSAGTFISKLGYQALAEDRMGGQPVWWLRRIWKIPRLSKCKIILSLALRNKLLTWSNLLKCGWIGPNIFLLYR
jgi:hypothetical protein